MDRCPHCGDASEMPFCDCPMAWEEARLAQAEAKKREASQETITWITDGSLPENADEVIVCTKGGRVNSAYCFDSVWYWTATDSFIGKADVKAWADMPEGPKP